MKVTRKLFGLVALDRAKCRKCRRQGFLDSYGYSKCCGIKMLDDGTQVEVERSSDVVFNRRHKRLSENQKIQILVEQGYRCIYCFADLNKETTHFDHIIAFIYSGDNTERNMAAACSWCNLKKSSKVFNSLQEAQEWLSVAKRESERDRRS